MRPQKAIKQLKELEKKGGTMRLAAEEWKADYEILISTIMSARTRDEVTIPVAEKLFKKYPTPEKLARAKRESVEKAINPVNFYKNKAKNIHNCAKEIVEKYNGEIPHDFEKLIELPGVGRKTANVFLSELQDDAIAIDTHVWYISRYLAWTDKKDPEKVEKDLQELFPKNYWSKINPVLVRFGKKYTSRKEKDELLDEIKKIR
ncbi:MAG: endonuclease III [Candidatus Pacearchaeota archaeon]